MFWPFLMPQAEHLIKRGHYAAARELLHRARAQAAACDHPEAEARALLMEARCEATACDYARAIRLVQQAQKIGGGWSGSSGRSGSQPSLL
jgi:hypothetical protein